MGRTAIKLKPLSVVLCAILLAAAPAQGLEAEFYGQGHISADSVDDGQNRSEYFASNSSRLGLRGRQQLSDGIDLLFQYEQGVDLTGQGENDGNGPGSTSGLFTAARVSYLGVTGDYGTLRAGKLDGLNQWVYDYNLFADQVGDLGNLWGGTGLAGRISDAAQYVSPVFEGFTVGLTYVPEEGVDDADLFLLKADYQRNELKLGLAFADIGSDWQAIALTGGYEWDEFTFGGGWQREESIADIRGNDRNSYTVGASFALKNGVIFKAQVARSNGKATDSDATQWSVGVDYQWDSALTLYLALATTQNDDNATFSANNWGKGDAVFPAAGQNPNAVSFGMVYRFQMSAGRHPSGS
ncbi:MAG: porin [Woeseiaceae bacterium]|nr:porin [Woeseiaceae bacterium]